jgi:hypothetical protein
MKFRLLSIAIVMASFPHHATADDAVGRYQIVPMAGGYGAMILDTKDGDLWRAWWPSAMPGQAANPGGIAYIGRAIRNTPSKAPDLTGR